MAIVLTVIAYAPALHGPFLLDDIGNLDPVRRWLDGALTARNVALDNRSGLLGRPLSMVTFLFDAWRTGDMHSFTFKPTNLAIHILCGALTYALTETCLKALGEPTQRRRLVAMVIVVLWLWMPIHVSTVLYVIQRMAQLSTLWMLTTLVFYARMRLAMEANSTAARTAGLWIGTLTLTCAATLSKENGLLAIPLAAVMEWTIFARARRPMAVTAGFAALLAIPALVVLVVLAMHPGYLPASYAARDFTLGQRLLTEPRILWDYIGTSFFPVGSWMGIYHDNYVVSKSLLRPVGTLTAIVAWISVVAWALAWRRKVPLFAFGVLGFVVAHVMESGPIALELYFEHRNYLPSVFALLACAGLVTWATHAFDFTVTFRRAAKVGLVGLLAIYGLGTWNQASAWGDADEFYALQYDYNPTSPRLLSALTARAMLAKDLPAALAYIDQAERHEDVSEHGTSTLWRFLAYCETGAAPIPDSLYTELEGRAQGRITSYAMTAWELLANRLDKGCPSLDAPRTARAGLDWLRRTMQVPADQSVWRTRYNVARILARSGDIESAAELTNRAWIDSGWNNGIGALLFQFDAALGHVERCKDILRHLERSYGGGDRSLDEVVDAFREAMPRLEAQPAKTHP